MSWYAWLFAIAAVGFGFLGLGLAVVISCEEERLEKTYSSDSLCDEVRRAERPPH